MGSDQLSTGKPLRLDSSRPSALNIDKTSLVWVTSKELVKCRIEPIILVFAKTKADIDFYNTKWKGIDKALIDEVDMTNIKEKKDFLKYVSVLISDFFSIRIFQLRDRSQKCLTKVIERFVTVHRFEVKDSYSILDVKNIQKKPC